MSRPHDASPRWRRAHGTVAPLEGGVVHHVLDASRFDLEGPLPVVLPPWPGLDRAARRAAAHGVPVVRRAPAPRPEGTGAWLAGRPVHLVHVHYATSFDA